MTYSVEINSVEITLLENTLSIEKRIEERSVASFTVLDTEGTLNLVRGMQVSVYDELETLAFAGFIDTAVKSRLSVQGTGLFYEVQCMDNHYLADKRLIVRSYTNQTMKTIVEDIVSGYLADEGITIGDVQTGPTIPTAYFNYVKASDAFDAMKETSGYIWFIDELKRLYFIDRSTYVSPWDLDNSSHMPLEGSISLSIGNPLYRNRQYVRGGKGVTSLQSETRTGDGETKSFVLGYPLAEAPQIEEDDVPKTVGIKGLDTDKDYYWSKGDNTVSAEVAPETGVVIEISYCGQYPLVTMAFDDVARASRQTIEGGTGLVEDIVTEAQLEDQTSMKDSAKNKIIRYCQEAEKLVYATREPGLAPGQIQKITYPLFGFTDHEMLIESINITSEDGAITYEISAITGPAMGSWSKFFASLITRQDQAIKVGDSLLLVLMIQSENLALEETPVLQEWDFSGGIVNDWVHAHYNIEHERLDINESEPLTSHAKNNYLYDDSAAKYDFATWG